MIQLLDALITNNHRRHVGKSTGFTEQEAAAVLRDDPALMTEALAEFARLSALCFARTANEPFAGDYQSKIRWEALGRLLAQHKSQEATHGG